MAGRDARHARPPPGRRRRCRARSSAAARRTATSAAGSAAPAPTRARRGCRRRAGAGRSRCRARPGSPTACRARRWRSAAAPARCRRARRPATKVLSSARELGRIEPGDEVGEVEGVGADVADAAAGAGSAPGRCARRPASGRWPRAARSASPARTRPARRGSRRARPSAHHAGGPGAPSDSRCSCSVTANSAAAPAASASRRRASASVVVSGLSQITWMPASRKASATGACRWFGVTIATASMPSARAASAAPSPRSRRRCGRREAERAARAQRLVGLDDERAGDELVAVVEPRGDAVHGADEGALAAADHAEADRAARRRPRRPRRCCRWP